MKKIIACIDNSAAAQPVLAVARSIAGVFGAQVEAVHVAEDGDRTARAVTSALGVRLLVLRGDPLDQLVAHCGDDDVVAVAVGVRGHRTGARPAGHLALALANHIDQPVLMVPPDVVAPDEVHRVLIAMEGTGRNARNLKRVVELAADAQVELIVVHVDDEGSIPSFSDQVQHETDAYAQQFLGRYLHGAPEARLEMRIGTPADEILDAVESEHPDLLALGWPQSDDPERGAVARDLLDRSNVPMLLVALT
jgi:nucleotide-binding universal stress UspA family protein